MINRCYPSVRITTNLIILILLSTLLLSTQLSPSNHLVFAQYDCSSAPGKTLSLSGPLNGGFASTFFNMDDCTLTITNANAFSVRFTDNTITNAKITIENLDCTSKHDAVCVSFVGHLLQTRNISISNIHRRNIEITSDSSAQIGVVHFDGQVEIKSSSSSSSNEEGEQELGIFISHITAAGTRITRSNAPSAPWAIYLFAVRFARNMNLGKKSFIISHVTIGPFSDRIAIAPGNYMTEKRRTIQIHAVSFYRHEVALKPYFARIYASHVSNIGERMEFSDISIRDIPVIDYGSGVDATVNRTEIFCVHSDMFSFTGNRAHSYSSSSSSATTSLIVNRLSIINLQNVNTNTILSVHAFQFARSYLNYFSSFHAANIKIQNSNFTSQFRSAFGALSVTAAGVHIQCESNPPRSNTANAHCGLFNFVKTPPGQGIPVSFDSNNNFRLVKRNDEALGGKVVFENFLIDHISLSNIFQQDTVPTERQDRSLQVQAIATTGGIGGFYNTQSALMRNNIISDIEFISNRVRHTQVAIFNSAFDDHSTSRFTEEHVPDFAFSRKSVSSSTFKNSFITLRDSKIERVSFRLHPTISGGGTRDLNEIFVGNFPKQLYDYNSYLFENLTINNINATQSVRVLKLFEIETRSSSDSSSSSSSSDVQFADSLTIRNLALTNVNLYFDRGDLVAEAATVNGSITGVSNVTISNLTVSNVIFGQDVDPSVTVRPYLDSNIESLTVSGFRRLRPADSIESFYRLRSHFADDDLISQHPFDPFSTFSVTNILISNVEPSFRTDDKANSNDYNIIKRTTIFYGIAIEEHTGRTSRQDEDSVIFGRVVVENVVLNRVISGDVGGNETSLLFGVRFQPSVVGYAPTYTRVPYPSSSVFKVIDIHLLHCQLTTTNAPAFMTAQTDFDDFEIVAVELWSTAEMFITNEVRNIFIENLNASYLMRSMKTVEIIGVRGLARHSPHGRFGGASRPWTMIFENIHVRNNIRIEIESYLELSALKGPNSNCGGLASVLIRDLSVQDVSCQLSKRDRWMYLDVFRFDQNLYGAPRVSPDYSPKTKFEVDGLVLRDVVVRQTDPQSTNVRPFYLHGMRASGAGGISLFYSISISNIELSNIVYDTRFAPLYTAALNMKFLGGSTKREDSSLTIKNIIQDMSGYPLLGTSSSSNRPLPSSRMRLFEASEGAEVRFHAINFNKKDVTDFTAVTISNITLQNLRLQSCQDLRVAVLNADDTVTIRGTTSNNNNPTEATASSFLFSVSDITLRNIYPVSLSNTVATPSLSGINFGSSAFLIESFNRVSFRNIQLYNIFVEFLVTLGINDDTTLLELSAIDLGQTSSQKSLSLAGPESSLSIENVIGRNIHIDATVSNWNNLPKATLEINFVRIQNKILNVVHVLVDNIAVSDSSFVCGVSVSPTRLFSLNGLEAPKTKESYSSSPDSSLSSSATFRNFYLTNTTISAVNHNHAVLVLDHFVFLFSTIGEDNPIKDFTNILFENFYMRDSVRIFYEDRLLKSTTEMLAMNVALVQSLVEIRFDTELFSNRTTSSSLVFRNFFVNDAHLFTNNRLFHYFVILQKDISHFAHLEFDNFILSNSNLSASAPSSGRVTSNMILIGADFTSTGPPVKLNSVLNVKISRIISRDSRFYAAEIIEADLIRFDWRIADFHSFTVDSCSISRNFATTDSLWIRMFIVNHQGGLLGSTSSSASSSVSSSTPRNIVRYSNLILEHLDIGSKQGGYEAGIIFQYNRYQPSENSVLEIDEYRIEDINIRNVTLKSREREEVGLGEDLKLIYLGKLSDYEWKLEARTQPRTSLSLGTSEYPRIFSFKNIFVDSLHADRKITILQLVRMYYFDQVEFRNVVLQNINMNCISSPRAFTNTRTITPIYIQNIESALSSSSYSSSRPSSNNYSDYPAKSVSSLLVDNIIIKNSMFSTNFEELTATQSDFDSLSCFYCEIIDSFFANTVTNILIENVKMSNNPFMNRYLEVRAIVFGIQSMTSMSLPQSLYYTHYEGSSLRISNIVVNNVELRGGRKYKIYGAFLPGAIAGIADREFSIQRVHLQNVKLFNASSLFRRVSNLAWDSNVGAGVVGVFVQSGLSFTPNFLVSDISVRNCDLVNGYTGDASVALGTFVLGLQQQESNNWTMDAVIQRLFVHNNSVQMFLPSSSASVEKKSSRKHPVLFLVDIYNLDQSYSDTISEENSTASMTIRDSEISGDNSLVFEPSSVPSEEIKMQTNSRSVDDLLYPHVTGVRTVEMKTKYLTFNWTISNIKIKEIKYRRVDPVSSSPLFVELARVVSEVSNPRWNFEVKDCEIDSSSFTTDAADGFSLTMLSLPQYTDVYKPFASESVYSTFVVRNSMIILIGGKSSSSSSSSMLMSVNTTFINVRRAWHYSMEHTDIPTNRTVTLTGNTLLERPSTSSSPTVAACSHHALCAIARFDEVFGLAYAGNFELTNNTISGKKLSLIGLATSANNNISHNFLNFDSARLQLFHTGTKIFIDKNQITPPELHPDDQFDMSPSQLRAKVQHMNNASNLPKIAATLFSDPHSTNLQNLSIDLHCNNWLRRFEYDFEENFIDHNPTVDNNNKNNNDKIHFTCRTETGSRTDPATLSTSTTITQPTATLMKSTRSRSLSLTDSIVVTSSKSPSSSLTASITLVPTPAKLVALPPPLKGAGIALTMSGGTTNVMNARKVIAISSLADCGKEEIIEDEYPEVDPDGNPLMLKIGGRGNKNRFASQRGSVITAFAMIAIWAVMWVVYASIRKFCFEADAKKVKQEDSDDDDDDSGEKTPKNNKNKNKKKPKPKPKRLRKTTWERSFRKIGFPGTLAVPASCFLPVAVNSGTSIASKYDGEEMLDIVFIAIAMIIGVLLPLAILIWVVRELNAHEILLPEGIDADDFEKLSNDELQALIDGGVDQLLQMKKDQELQAEIEEENNRKKRQQEGEQPQDQQERPPLPGVIICSKFVQLLEWLTDPTQSYRKSKFSERYASIFNMTATPLYIVFSYITVIGLEISEGATSLCNYNDRACCEGGLISMLVLSIADVILLFIFRRLPHIVRIDKFCVTICVLLSFVSSVLILHQYFESDPETMPPNPEDRVNHTDALIMLSEVTFVVGMVGGGFGGIAEFLGAFKELYEAHQKKMKIEEREMMQMQASSGKNNHHHVSRNKNSKEGGASDEKEKRKRKTNTTKQKLAKTNNKNKSKDDINDNKQDATPLLMLDDENDNDDINENNSKNNNNLEMKEILQTCTRKDKKGFDWFKYDEMVVGLNGNVDDVDGSPSLAAAAPEKKRRVKKKRTKQRSSTKFADIL